MPAPTKANFAKPDQSMHPTENMTVDVVELGGRTFHRVTIQPGWRWTKDLAPVVGTATCQTGHLLYILSGQVAIRTDSGEEAEFTAGDLADIPAGHDGWTVGDELASWIEIPR
jgi:mannose-6-phosphate isomerase-like protein (cupin superfamily)